jgi:Coenzyme PQQ synthesis protein D (PqqD)
VTNNSARFVRDADVIAQPSGESLVLFHMQSGRYFSLNECGARIWDGCDGTRTGAEIAELLIKEYYAPAEVRDDVSDLLLQLTEKGLVRTVESGSKAVP